jgi:hypothetical protein
MGRAMATSDEVSGQETGWQSRRHGKRLRFWIVTAEGLGGEQRGQVQLGRQSGESRRTYRTREMEMDPGQG